MTRRAKVFVSRIIPEAGLGLVRAACDVDIWQDALPPPYEELKAKVFGVDGILSTLNDQIDEELIIAAGTSLKVISQMSVGVDNIDVNAAHRRGIKVGNTPGVLTDATADITLALLLAAARRIVEGVEYIKSGQWRTWEPMGLLGGDLSGATLGIIGLGRIGRAVVRRASGFGMRIIAHSPRCPAEEAAALGVALVSLEQVLREADYLSIHVPLKPDTRHLIDRGRLALMKKSAILINTARGAIVDQRALYEAVKSGQIAGAALDVTDPEPIPLNDPLLTLPNVIVVPHIGSASHRTRDKMAAMAAENLLAGLAGQNLPNEV
jgi:lactate dehydrogenase-like 2-hydroxyacid dehydrogenase